MALQTRQRRIYTDRIYVWRKSNSRDSMGESTGGSYVYSNIPAKHYTTSNFDETTAVASALMGKNNIITADYVHFPLVDDSNTEIKIEGGDLIKTINPNGEIAWYMVTGFGKERWHFNVGEVFLLTTPAPV